MALMPGFRINWQAYGFKEVGVKDRPTAYRGIVYSLDEPRELLYWTKEPLVARTETGALLKLFLALQAAHPEFNDPDDVHMVVQTWMSAY